MKSFTAALIFCLCFALHVSNACNVQLRQEEKLAIVALVEEVKSYDQSLLPASNEHLGVLKVQNAIDRVSSDMKNFKTEMGRTTSELRRLQSHSNLASTQRNEMRTRSLELIMKNKSLMAKWKNAMDIKRSLIILMELLCDMAMQNGPSYTSTLEKLHGGVQKRQHWSRGLCGLQPGK